MSKNIKEFFFVVCFITISGIAFSQSIQYKLKTVVIDAGHGGKSPGAVVEGVCEKDIVLKVALKTGELISKIHPEVKVIYTRNKDMAVDLSERADIANKNNADLFISIHANFFKNPAINGSETYVLGLHKTTENLELAKLENSVILLEDDYNTRYEGFDPNQAESYIMFELLQDQFLEQSRMLAEKTESQFRHHTKRNSRGVKQAGFLVLKRATMPSVLIEIGYLSNQNDRAYMLTPNGVLKTSEAIAKAFTQYKNRLEGKTEEEKLVQANQEEPKVENQTDSVPKKTVEKNEVSSPSPVVTASNANTKKILDIQTLQGVWYGIQILASNKIVSDDDPRIQSCDSVFYLLEGGLHKYYASVLQDYSKMYATLPAIRKNFNGAFPVAFENGRKIDLKMARKQVR